MSAKTNTRLKWESESESDDEFETAIQQQLDFDRPETRPCFTANRLFRYSVLTNRLDRVQRLIGVIQPRLHAPWSKQDILHYGLWTAFKYRGTDRQIIRAICEAMALGDDGKIIPSQRFKLKDWPVDTALFVNHFVALEEMRKHGFDMSRLPAPFTELIFGEPCRCRHKLIHASFHGNVDMVQEVLSRVSKEEEDIGACAVTTNRKHTAAETKKTALKFAAWRGHSKVVKFLLAAGVSADFNDEEGRTPLAYAVCGGHTEVARCLLESGARIDQLIPLRWGYQTLLQAAAMSGRVEVTRLLLHFGVSPNATANGRGCTALMEAVSCRPVFVGEADVVDVLLSADAEINQQTAGGGKTALLLACLAGNYEATRKLVLAGADVNLSTYVLDGSQTPLMVASKFGYWMCIRELLLSNRVDINQVDDMGCTSLYYCCLSNNIIGALMLLRAGIDNGKEFEEKLTAAQPALGGLSDFRCKEVFKVIKSYSPSLQDLCLRKIRRRLPSPITEDAVRKLPFPPYASIVMGRKLMFR